MKLNNKGITLVEVIVTFALLMVILVGLFNIILDVKSDISEKQLQKDMTDFSDILVSKIQGDFIKSKVIQCSSGTCTYENGSSKSLSIAGTSINYGGITYTVPNDDVVVMLTGNGITEETDATNNITYIVVTYKYKILKHDEEYGFVIRHPISS